jgi:hypothetical protein
MNKRLLVLCTLIIALTVGLSASNSAASLWGGGEATNLDENGICTWSCYDGGSGSGPANGGRQCIQLCERHCGPPCIPRY